MKKLLTMIGAAAVAVGATLPMAAMAEAKSVVLQATGYTGTATISGFQALVKLTEGAYGFSYNDSESTDGSDLWFEDSSGNLVPHDIDEWNEGGTSYVWVRIPSLTPRTTSIAEITMHWGEVRTAVQTCNASDTWSGFVGVWHMNETGTTAEPDSTANGIDAAPVNNSSASTSINTATGQVGAGRSVAQATMFKVTGHASGISDAKVFTVGGWVYRTAGGDYPRIFVGNVDSSRNKWELYGQSGTELRVRGCNDTELTGCAVNIGTSEGWHYLTAVYDGTAATLYDNGNIAKSGTIGNAAQGDFFTIGGWTGRSDRSFVGTFDEVRMYNGIAEADRVAADYATMTSPTTFLTQYAGTIWTGAANDGGNVLTPENWDGGAVPGSSDNAVIGDAPVAVLGGSTAWTALTIGTTVDKTGTLTVNSGGALTLSSTLTFANADASSGILNVEGGSVTIQNLNTPNYAATSTVNVVSGAFTINDWADWGRNASGKAEFNQSGGTVTMKEGFQMGRDNNGTGIYNMSGGVLYGSSGDSFMVGRLGASTGIFNLTDGTVNFGAKDVCIGGWDNNAGSKATKGYFNQSGGTVTADGNIQIGRRGTGTWTQTAGDLTCNGYFSIGRYSGASGTYSLTGGTFTAPNTIFIGEGGTGTLTVGGTGVATVSNSVQLAKDSGASGSLYLNAGGKIAAKSIDRGSGSVDTVAFNGGTLEAVVDNASFLNNLGSMLLDAGGVEIDSAGHAIGVSGCDFDEVVGARFVKAGEGTLTLAAMPSADTVAVDGGTLALSAGDDNASARLAHRWSFTSNLSDSMTGKSGAITGTGTSYVTDGTSGSTALRLPGANNGKCYVNLGAKKLPSDSVTIEAWVTMRNIEDWVRVFLIQDGVTKSVSHSLAFISRTSDTGLDSAGTSTYIGSALQKDVQYYVAIAISPDGKGGSVTRRYIKKVGDSNFLFKNEATNAAWTISANMTTNPSDGHFWLGRSDYNNRDATADYDEVRVWNGALSDEAIALSAAKGPDATAADIAEIAASGTTVSRTLTVASGATLDVGAGNTLRQPVVNANGTLASGNLVVTERVNATVGETMTVASGATLDLSDAEIVVTNPEALTRDGFTLAVSPSGGIVPAAPRKLSGPLDGYSLFLSSTSARIGKSGLIIICY